MKNVVTMLKVSAKEDP